MLTSLTIFNSLSNGGALDSQVTDSQSIEGLVDPEPNSDGSTGMSSRLPL